MKRLLLSFLLLLLIVATSCKQEHGIGDESLLDFKEREQQRLGQSSPSPSPAAEAPSPPPQQKQGVGQAPQEQPQQQEPVIQISIRSDNAGSAFDPSVVRVTKGGKVTWVNNDSTARSVEADGGAFNSGLIPPGGSWTWTATRSGRHDYHDGTRPYAVASLEVVG